MADPTDAPPRRSSVPGTAGVGGAISDLVDSIKKSLPMPAHGNPPVGVGGQMREDAIDKVVDDTAGNSSTTPSHAGQQAQSSDHWNRY